jgi:Zn-dependent M28 family amino/carboxypeptidase
MKCNQLVLRLPAAGALIALAIGTTACMTRMTGHNPDGTLAPLTQREGRLRPSLAADVRTLSVDIGERNVAHPAAYAAAADWIGSQLRQAGLLVHEESYAAGRSLARNIVGEIQGTGARDQILIIGAHYDSVDGTPGANDNATGIATLLALARHFGKSHPQRTLRFVAFANEEPPFFHTDQMGSLVYARGCAARHENVAAMLSLETMGYYSDAAGSQHYPFPFSLLYPSTGNFLAFVGNVSSEGLTREAVRTFRRAGKLPAEGAAVADVVPGIGWSDHWSFWQTGVHAVMVTDTAPFRYAQYHEATDTPDKLDFDRLARAVVGLADVVRDLSRGERARSAP